MTTSTTPRSQVADFYNGKSLFVTGATGFMGKVLIHKLLTVSPDIERIYVLIRPKRGQDPQERLKTLFEAVIFESLSKKIQSKVVALTGDITLSKLGLSDEDEARLIRDVSVIFHSAATVKFDDDLSKAVSMNVQGTLSVIDLARKMGPNLVSFVHVSTAYSNCYLSHIQEMFYDGETSSKDIIELCKNVDPCIIDDPEMTQKLIGKHPNTYTFTKALAEQAILENASDLPLSIIRPSIVVASLKEPVPGWVDNLNGPTGIVAGAAAGILRTMRVDFTKKADIMPVDVAIDLMCVIGWKTGFAKPVDQNNSPIPIYNCTSGNSRPFKWRDFELIGLKHIWNYPLENVMWYPGGSFKSSICADRISRVFVHYIPAICVDLVLKLIGKTPFMLKICKKITKAMGALEYFAMREWSWENCNVHGLNNSLSEGDKKLFNCDLRKLPDWDRFIENYVCGVRHFILKNKPGSLPKCRRKLMGFWVLDWLVRIIMLFLLYKFVAFLWQFAMN